MDVKALNRCRTNTKDQRIDDLIKELKDLTGASSEDEKKATEGLVELMNRMFDIDPEKGESILLVKKDTTLFSGCYEGFDSVPAAISSVIAHLINDERYMPWFLFVAKHIAGQEEECEGPECNKCGKWSGAQVIDPNKQGPTIH